MARSALDAFERGELPSVFADLGSHGAEPTPEQLVRAAVLAAWDDDHNRALGYLERARTQLADRAANAPAPGDISAWSLGASAETERDGWMLTRVAKYIAAPAAFARAVAGAHVERHLGEPARLVGAMAGAITDVALTHDDERTHALCAQAAQLSGDTDLADAVAKFNKDQVRTLGRVLRALHHDPALLHPAVAGGPGEMTLGVLGDIAADGVAWRTARLGALVGHDEEVETLRLTGRHITRHVNVGSGVPLITETTAGPHSLALAAHRLRVARDAGVPMRANVRLYKEEDFADAVEEFARRPGRLRCRAVRVRDQWRGEWLATVGLAVAVTYEGVDADSGEPFELTVRHHVGESRQAKDEAQLARLVGNVPAGCPPVEDGYWDLDANGSFTPLIPGAPDPGPAPTAPLDAHLGRAYVCPHPDAGWRLDGASMVAVCDGCGERLVRRPALRFGEPTLSAGRFAELVADPDAAYARVAALAGLVGKEPPRSFEELIKAPRITDWRAEWRDDIAAARAPRRSAMSIGEAMRRR